MKTKTIEVYLDKEGNEATPENANIKIVAVYEVKSDGELGKLIKETWHYVGKKGKEKEKAP